MSARTIRLGSIVLVGAAVVALGYQTLFGQAPPLAFLNEWPTYGHDAGGMRFSPLKQITPANVTKLTVAWTYHMKPPVDPAVAAAAAPPGRGGRGGGGNGFAQSEVTPLVVGGMMYISTPYQRVVALDPTTGKEIWTYRGQASTRGVEYWPGDGAHGPRVVFAGGGGLVELDAKAGTPAQEFGKNGMLAAPGAGGFGGGATSPPIIYKNIIISASANPNRDGRDGDVRGFDVITGKELWIFHTIPQTGEFGYDTWAPGSAEVNTGARVWGLMTVDAERGIVYFPVKAPNWDRYGGNRHGNNLFSSSIVGLDANTGKYLWHFQIVHHDIWDFDPSAPPTLFNVRKAGKTIPAVGLVSKSGLVFILDRLTGTPIYPVEERPVAASDVPEEQASPTQPFPVVTPPIARQSMSRADIAEVTSDLYKYCTDLIDKNNIGMGGPYNPPGFNRPTVNFPGTIGSANWGGMSFNPGLGYLFVNSHDLGQITGIGLRGGEREVLAVAGAGSGNNPAIPYDMVGLLGRFKSLDLNMLCNAPPWGSLTAVNVNTGLIAWKVPLGITESLPPEKQKTGRPNLGGTITTASGLVFIGATDDSRFRAFDGKTGKEIWTVKLPAAAHAVPSTYLGKNGKQYVVVTATGGGFLQSPLISDSIIAFALP